MPSNLLTADTSFPKLEKSQSTDEKFETVTNYLYMLLEQLRYTLCNLGVDNFNSAEYLKIGETITTPIYARLENDEGALTQLSIAAGELKTQISDANGNISALQQTSSSLSSAIADANNNISSLQQTATSLQSQITDNKGNISSLQQTATSLSSQISGKIDSTAAQSLINQSLSGITLGVTSSDGTTVFTLKSGSTTLSTKTLDLTVDAVNISGTLNANNITMKGLFTVYYGSSIYGYLGASTASTALGTGVALCDSTASNGFLAMTSGARMQYGSTANQVYVIDGSVGITADGTYFYFYPSYFATTGGGTLGTSSRLWGQIYSTNSAVSTSDRNLKHDIEDLDERYLQFILWLIPKRFKLNSGTSDRYHIGFIAQDVYEGMELFGITDLEFAGWVKDVDADGNEILMLRYEEFIGLLQLGLLNHEKRISVLEARV